MEAKEYYTLITGASAGIGKALAFECASRGMNVLLVARNKAKLHDITSYLRQQFPINAHYYQADLTLENAPDQMYKWCVENSYRVNFLINNAGMGNTNNFLDNDVEYYKNMILLNNMALVKTTWLFVANMKQYPKAYILNLSSMAGLFPIPFKSVYSASKAFVNSFSLALRQEMKHTPISISVACPGGVDTNESVKERIKDYGLLKRSFILSAETVAKSIVSGTLRGKQIIIPGYGNNLANYVLKCLPSKARFALLIKSLKQDIGK